MGIKRPVTKYPSLTSCPLKIANANSIARPTIYETAIIGTIFKEPWITASIVEKAVPN